MAPAAPENTPPPDSRPNSTTSQDATKKESALSESSDTGANSGKNGVNGASRPDEETASSSGSATSFGAHNSTAAEDPHAAGENEQDGDDKSMGLLDHLGELRQRLLKMTIAACAGFAVCWVFVDPLFNILLEPLLKVLPEGAHAQYTTLPEGFFTRMRVAFVAGLFLASPIIFYQIWAFVAPGLYDEEKRHILPIAFLSALFFICGGLFCYYIVFPFAFNFFISYSTPEIVITPKVSDYLSFCLKLIFAFGLIFEMPIFTFFLARMGILTAGMMKKGRKYAVVGIFILAAILTPPDVVSQLLMACPMLVLYEGSIWIAAVFGKRKNDTPDQETGEKDGI